MSEVKVNKISPRTNCGTTQLGDAGDTITVTGDLKSNSLKSASGSTITLGQSGDTIQLGCGASQTGFGRTGTVDWDTTAKTASFTAVSGNGYFVNTTSGAITVTLPAGSAGDIVSLADYAATWQTNAVTVTPNGTDKIGGVNISATLSTEGQSVTFVYVDSTQGWINTGDSTSNVRGESFINATGGTITTSGDYKIHTFTGPGTFTVCAVASCASQNIVSYMVVGGGGSGGRGGAGGDGGGGGGAGGFREYKGPADCYTASPLNGNPGGTAVTVTATGYPITVGGGSGGSGPTAVNGGKGSNSVFSTITSTGGGGGGSNEYGIGFASPPSPDDGTGGSGGGGRGGGIPSGVVTGQGNTPPVSPSQGNPGGFGGGGLGPNPLSPDNSSGGGGGATAPGSNSGPSTVAGPGGAGATTSISGTPTAYAGGGGGSAAPTIGSGGVGGGGYGSNAAGANAGSGTANTGGGGGGAGCAVDANSGAGGSGIVIIRYKYQ